MPDREWQIIPSQRGLAVNVCQHDNASHEWIFFFFPFFCVLPCPTLKISTWEQLCTNCKALRSHVIKQKPRLNPRGETGRPLTAVLLVAVVGAVVVVVASPQGRDAASVLALKLPGFTF